MDSSVSSAATNRTSVSIVYTQLSIDTGPPFFLRPESGETPVPGFGRNAAGNELSSVTGRRETRNPSPASPCFDMYRLHRTSWSLAYKASRAYRMGSTLHGMRSLQMLLPSHQYVSLSRSRPHVLLYLARRPCYKPEALTPRKNTLEALGQALPVTAKI